MKHLQRLLLCMCITLITISTFAQHSLQLDDGAGNIFVIAAPSGSGGTYILPIGGGTLITTGMTSSSPWLLGGNSLSSLGASPTQWFGTSTNDDVIMKANNVEILRLVSGGGVVIPGSALSINGVAYTFPASAPNGVLTNTGGVLSWAAAGGSGWGLTGNALTGTLPSSPTEFFGSTNGADVVMVTNSVVQMRLLSSGGIDIPTSAGGGGVIFQNGDRYIHSYGAFNFFAGTNAGNFAMGGISNTAIGASAFFSNTSGELNTAIGRRALYSNTTGNLNTAIGAYSLRSNTTGDSNTASGYYSLLSNTVGTKNTATGMKAMFSNTTASHNVAIGTNALYAQSYSNGGTAWGSYNTAIGDEALYKNQPISTTTGAFNAALGAAALYENTTGSYNVGLGVSALYTNTTGDFNAAVGTNSLTYNTKGTHNSALGTHALYSNTTSSYNVAVGYRALYDLSYSNTATVYSGENTAIGYEALENTQPTSTSTGIRNTALGSQTGQFNTTGSRNTFLGYQADASATSLSNATALGNGAVVNASNKIQLGNSAVTRVSTYGSLSIRNVDYVWPLAAAVGVLTSDGSGNLSWAAAGLSGLTTNGFVYPTSSSTLSSTAAASNGELLIGSTSAAPVKATLTAGKNVSITNGPGSISIASAPTVLIEADDKTIGPSSTTLTNADDLTIALAAGENVYIDGMLHITTVDNAATDLKIAFTYTTGSLTQMSIGVTANNITNPSGNHAAAILTTSGTSGLINIDGNEDLVCMISGFVKANTAGTLSLQLAPNTNNATRSVTLKGGSVLRVTRF